METTPLLAMRGITKAFGGAVALADVHLTIHAGEVHALVGENGAGKSTLIKILTGAYALDAGAILMDGKSVAFRSPQEAQQHGIVAVYQEVQLLPSLTVAENLLLGREPRRWGLIDWHRMNLEAQTVLAGLGLNLDPRAPLGSLTLAQRQMAAIARGVSLGARLLVLDEPTSSLSEREVVTLYDVIRRLKQAGTAVVYISHRFEELYAVCDTVTVLRDGRLVATQPLAGLERLDLVCLMLGKKREELSEENPPPNSPPSDASPPLLEADDLCQGRSLQGVTVAVRCGEIVGLAGLLGSGRTETARAIFGLDSLSSGDVRLDGKILTLRSPIEAIDAGMGFLPEDRKTEGIIPELSVRENLTLAALPTLSRMGVIDRARQRELVERFVARLRIKVASLDQPIRELSGGNQQKVLLARWLCRNPKLLLLDEPTRGIDLGAKAEIQSLINEMAREGLGVLLISSELDQLIASSQRVVVLRDGRSVAELPAGAINETSVLQAMAGDAPARNPRGNDE